ncbi:hypothetical protein L6452_16846 [Arctium lappa]|uniref:Uncharacterized protein n=1 Tax=Arctium lappa TaxID=4217 RepID=A0ACB9C1Z5_ARCLA|nr:hypothetical protein L6452_16846 [Arctium lappa]
MLCVGIWATRNVMKFGPSGEDVAELVLKRGFYQGFFIPRTNSISPSKLRRQGFRYAIREDLVLRDGFHEINGS